MSVPLIASVDVGTTSTRIILFSKQGKPILTHQIEYSTTASMNKDDKFSPTGTSKLSAEGIRIRPGRHLEIESGKNVEGPTLRFPEPGWVEVVPSHIVGNVLKCLSIIGKDLKKLNSSRSNGEDYYISGFGITNMRETTILFSKKTGLPLYNGIVWNDTRTNAIVARIKKSVSAERLEEIRKLSGIPMSSYFSALKLQWMFENVPAVQEAYEQNDLMFSTVDTWLIYTLTKEHAHVTDVTNACRTMFMNIDTLKYDDELLDFWKLDKKKINLPEIRSSSELYGHFAITKETIKSLGIDVDTKDLEYISDVPIAGCLGDQSASMVGQLAFESGSAKNTYGTGCFLLYNTGHEKMISNNGALTTLGYWFKDLQGDDKKPCYALEGSIAVAGSSVQWLRDNLRLINRSADVGPLASQVSNTGGVVFVPAFSGLFAPYWDSDARGTIFGITQYTNSSHIARAAIEGVCYQTLAILKAMEKDSGMGLKILKVDGGMSQSNEVMQIQSDILGDEVTVERMGMPECTALGAAIAAGLSGSVGLWKSIKEVTDSIGNGVGGDKFTCTSDEEKRNADYKRWEKAIERAKGWMADEL